jgi:tetratricopeptide (TPR) repeat protein
MKISQIKRSRWMYVSLGIMLFALVCFSLAPLVSSMLQSNSSRPNKTTLDISEKLASEALGYELVLEREPTNQNALQGLVEVRLRQGDLQAAINPLEQLAQLNPQQSAYMLLLAQAKQQIEDYEGAIGTYRTLFASHPQDMQALKGWVDVLVAQNRYSEAVGLVQTNLKNAIATQTNPETSSVTLDLTSLQLLLGEIYLGQKQYSQAITVYEQAIKADPQDFRPVLAKALVLKEQGNDTDAQPLFTQAIALAPVEYKDQIKAIAGEKIEAKESKQQETDS